MSANLNPNIAYKLLAPLDDTAASPSIQFGGPTNQLSGTGIYGDIGHIRFSVGGINVLTITSAGLIPAATAAANTVYAGPTTGAAAAPAFRALVAADIPSTLSALTISGNGIVIATARTPASAVATGVAGTICWDADFLYVCVATNTWTRVAIATWP